MLEGMFVGTISELDYIVDYTVLNYIVHLICRSLFLIQYLGRAEQERPQHA